MRLFLHRIKTNLFQPLKKPNLTSHKTYQNLTKNIIYTIIKTVGMQAREKSEKVSHREVSETSAFQWQNISKRNIKS